MSEQQKLSPVEKIKTDSQGLRGTLEQSLANDLTGAINDADIQVIKFHGMYLQDDRDRRDERAAKKLERLYSFMIRLRLPGGNLTPAQWQAVHHIAGEHSTGVIKITTRQTLQLHGLLKAAVKPTIQAFDAAALDSIATCGDINRNVAASSHPAASPLHAQVHGFADTISQALMPKTRAYYEIWLDEEQLIDKKEDDPLYQHRYLPRKFKIGIAIPPNNDVDVFTNDIGLIAIIENNQLIGYNIAIGGGLSQTHGNADTYPRLASVIGFTEGEEKTLKAIYEILTIQRDYGNRTDRKLARLKYTVDKMGLPWWKEEIERRTGFALEPARPYHFSSRKDLFGWQASHDGLWHYTALVEHGRVTDDENAATKTCLYEIATTGKAQFRFTSNQNVMLYGIHESDKPLIDEVLHRHGLKQFTEQSSELRKHSMACVAFNTCPLALAEAQRYLPSLISKLEPLVVKYGLEKDETIVRMTGCPNGCGRSVAAEIGFIGTAYGRYNIQLGGDRNGQRLNVLYKKDVDEAGILQTLEELFAAHAQHRLPAETLGDFALRYMIHPATTIV
ncbi:MAG: NADPH-dependent assimilatory sulfite reductase hemoprotein subunit [Chitinophagaceae bacterium]|nr:NADPH-dependent assimilatory sulfite reductase hemoprotein subunit [Chitinophagaceae bacterium]